MGDRIVNHNFIIANCDTDSISLCRANFLPFSKDEQKALIKEINALSPEFMTWSDDGYYKKVIILKAKNYILQKYIEDLKPGEKEIVYKGSGLKSSKTEPALKEFLHKIIGTILEEKYEYTQIYNSYIKEILDLKDITRWASKKTLTSTTYSSDRANETKIIDAIKDTEYKEGDKIFTYFDNKDELKLVEHYNNDHNIPKLLKKLHSTAQIFKNIIPKETFKNYSLKKSQEELISFK